MSKGSDVAGIADAVSGWFQSHARDLPWRRRVRDPYHALVSEFMLQQTQVARVVERFEAFVARFPDVGSLARAQERSVLAMWSGLGYYRRARHLHQAAKQIARDHAGEVPSDLRTLRSLPGIGAYTAGAIASIAFGARHAAIDGNVVRVLLRIRGEEVSAEAGREPVTRLAEALVREADSPGMLNEGLMELGAVVCTPRSPACGSCPVSAWCRARERGSQERIPARSARATRSRLWCASVVVRDGTGRLMVEQRPREGLWAGLWQAPTIERADRAPTPEEVEAALGIGALERVERFERVLTHRLVAFDVYRGRGGADGAFKTRAQIERLGLASPQRRILLG